MLSHDGARQLDASIRRTSHGWRTRALARRPSGEHNMNVLLPETAADAYTLGYADGFRGDPPLTLYTWVTQNAYAAGYRAGQRGH
jgi:hypothetical protein